VFGSFRDISVEVLLQDHFVCTMWLVVLLSFIEYTIPGPVMHVQQWVVHEELFCRYAVPNIYAGSYSIILHCSFLFWIMLESQASEYTKMLQRWLPFESMPGLVTSRTVYRSYRSEVINMDPDWPYKYPILLVQSGIIQHASNVLHDCGISPFNDCI